MKIEIKSCSGLVLFSTNAETVREAVIAAVKNGASLQGADLRYESLQGADLRYANLQGADLRYAYLQNADLQYAYLRYADLEGANLPSPTMLLLANWREVSNELCADLMEFDAWTHGNREAFQKWAEEADGPCPYTNAGFQRAVCFHERRELFGKGKLRSPGDLIARLFKEKGVKR